jgi:hypothetical protein
MCASPFPSICASPYLPLKRLRGSNGHQSNTHESNGQRQSIQRPNQRLSTGLTEMDADDLVIVADMDELITADTVQLIRQCNVQV